MPLFILLLLLFCTVPVNAYIDPATGSMLFSMVIGIVATLFFVAKAVFYKISFVLTGFDRKRDKNHFPFVIYSEGKKYWNVFRPILNEFEKRRIYVVYYTSAEDDQAFSQNFKYITPKYIGQGNKAYMKLSLLSADVCLMTIPGLDVYQLKRSKNVKHYAHVFHGIGDHCGYRLFGIDYYDSIMLTNEINAQYIRELEAKRGLQQKKLILAGAPDLDIMAEKVKKLPPVFKDKFTVLLAASWGPDAILSKYGADLIDKIADIDWDIIIRPHPQMKISEKSILDNLQERYKDKKNIFWDFEVNNLISMAKADILISDFSGIIFEYAFLFNKPFIYTEFEDNRPIYDSSDLAKPTWKKEILNKIGFELKKNNFKDIVSIIENVSKDRTKLNAIRETKDLLWANQGKAAEIIVNFLIDKQKQIANKG